MFSRPYKILYIAHKYLESNLKLNATHHLRENILVNVLIFNILHYIISRSDIYAMATSGLLELPQIVSSPMKWDDDVHLEILNRSSLFHHLLDPQNDFPTSPTPVQVFATHLDATVTLGSYDETYPDSEEIFNSVILSTLFIFLEVLGLVGNVMVIVVILTNKEMRITSINLFIANLAFADLCVMLTGILEITIFIGDMGWPFPHWLCKAERFFLITCLYSSIFTTLAASVERLVLEC